MKIANANVTTANETTLVKKFKQELAWLIPLTNFYQQFEHNGKHYTITQREKDNHYVLFGNGKEMCASPILSELTDWAK